MINNINISKFRLDVLVLEEMMGRACTIAQPLITKCLNCAKY